MCIGLHMIDNRYLCTLNSYVRNKAYLKGCIAEGYLAEECATFYSRYLNDVEIKYNRCDRNYVDLKNVRYLTRTKNWSLCTPHM